MAVEADQEQTPDWLRRRGELREAKCEGTEWRSRAGAKELSL